MSSIKSSESMGCSVADMVAELCDRREREAEELELCRTARLTEIPVLAVSLTDQFASYLCIDDERRLRLTPRIDARTTAALKQRVDCLAQSAELYESRLERRVKVAVTQLQQLVKATLELQEASSENPRARFDDVEEVVDFAFRELADTAADIRTLILPS